MIGTCPPSALRICFREVAIVNPFSVPLNCACSSATQECLSQGLGRHSFEMQSSIRIGPVRKQEGSAGWVWLGVPHRLPSVSDWSWNSRAWSRWELAQQISWFLLSQGLAVPSLCMGWGGPQCIWTAHRAAAGFKVKYSNEQSKSHVFPNLALNQAASLPLNYM